MKGDRDATAIKGLSLSDIPANPKSWGDIIKFAAIFSPQVLRGEWTVRGLSDITETASIEEIRAALYCEWRRYNHFAHDPEDKVINEARQAIELIRTKLRGELEAGGGTNSPRDAQFKRTSERVGAVPSSIISTPGEAKQPVEGNDVGNLLLKILRLLALATIAWTFSRVWPPSTGLAAGIVLSWTAGVTGIFIKTQRNLRNQNLSQAGTGLRSWFLAGALPPAIFCFLWSITYWSIYGVVGLGDVTSARSGVVGRGAQW